MDLKIVIGLIEFYFMVGFLGGCKLICFGIVGLEMICEWYGFWFFESFLVMMGELCGNLVYEENIWIVKYVGCDFIVNVVIDDFR